MPDTPAPIGYVILFRPQEPGSAWEPMALTHNPNVGPGPSLMRRSCFTMFPTPEAAEAELRRLQGLPFVKGAEVNVVAVFPAGVAAPHK